MKRLLATVLFAAFAVAPVAAQNQKPAHFVRILGNTDQNGIRYIGATEVTKDKDEVMFMCKIMTGGSYNRVCSRATSGETYEVTPVGSNNMYWLNPQGNGDDKSDNKHLLVQLGIRQKAK